MGWMRTLGDNYMENKMKYNQTICNIIIITKVCPCTYSWQLQKYTRECIPLVCRQIKSTEDLHGICIT